jgi:branched-chain amino acid transport system permease protein
VELIALYVLLGLGDGALIAAIALGVVATYRGSGIVNVSVGAVAMLAGYSFWSLTDGEFASLPMVPALIVSLLFVLVVGALIELLAFRPLRTASPLAKLVSSLAVLLIAQASMLLAFGTSPHTSRVLVLPSDPSDNVRLSTTVVVPVDRFILAGLVIALAAALWALYRWTRFGLATRAASENEVAAILSGQSPNLISMVNTLITSLIAGGIGILAASVVAVDAFTLPLEIVPALAAALLARFTSFGIACAAGLGIGILDSLIIYFEGLDWFPSIHGTLISGVPELVAFLIIIVAMFLRGTKIPGRGELVEQRLPAAPRPQRLLRVALPLAVVCAVALVVLPFDFRQALVVSLIGALMALSLVVITGFVGQVSVVQLALAGATGFTIFHISADAGIGFPLAALAGVAVSVVIGLLTAVSALRVRGVNLTVVTLAAAVAISNFGFNNSTWGAGPSGSPVPDLGLFGLDLSPRAGYRGLDGNQPSPIFGWVALIATVALCLLVGYLRRGSLGQRMLAVRSNERAAEAAAINPRTIKLTAFGISAFIAGVAGCLYAYNFGSVSPERFSAFTALGLIAFAYAGGITQISGAVFAGVISAQALVPYALDKWFGLNGNWFLLFGGVLLLFTLIQNPEGVAGDFYKRTHKRPVLSRPQRAPDETARPPAAQRKAVEIRDGAVLSVDGLSVDFGGVHALRDVTFEVRSGELVGLIGPNGAGKSTFLDAIGGFVASTGRVELDGHDIGGLPAYERSRRGFGRTWQSTELFHDLDVRENLLVAAEPATGGAGSTLSAQTLARRLRGMLQTDNSARRDADEALAIVGMDWAAEATPDELSESERKMVGVARALVGNHRLICLDEPAAGLDRTESQELGRRLRGLADDGQSILLIDHDMGLVLNICDRIVVLEFGKVIADGPPESIRRDQRVVAAYLGGGEGAQQKALQDG